MEAQWCCLDFAVDATKVIAKLKGGALLCLQCVSQKYCAGASEQMKPKEKEPTFLKRCPFTSIIDLEVANVLERLPDYARTP